MHVFRPILPEIRPVSGPQGGEHHPLGHICLDVVEKGKVGKGVEVWSSRGSDGTGICIGIGGVGMV